MRINELPHTRHRIRNRNQLNSFGCINEDAKVREKESFSQLGLMNG
jgi:hypothetical protein